MKIISNKQIAIISVLILFLLAGCQSSHDASTTLKEKRVNSFSSRTIIINKDKMYIEPNLIPIKIIYK